MQRLSIFIFCLFVCHTAANAQEKTTTTKTTTTVKKTTTTTKAVKSSKKPIATVQAVPPPPPPPANVPAPIPVPMDPAKPPMPQDPTVAPPPLPMAPGSKPLPPGQRGVRKGAGLNHDHAGPGVHPGVPPGPPVNNLPGGPAPRPYDPSVDNVPVGPNAGVFKFKEETHDFGTFEEGPIVETDFEFTNDGKEPITIRDAHASCGCTIPTWPKEPIAPGKTAKIHVTFNSKGRVGVIHKDVTIVSNAKQQPMMLHIGGEVKAAAVKN